VSVIPEKALLARRLAQSVNPILPNGVHRRALDAYRVILARIGREQLARDLALWTQAYIHIYMFISLHSFHTRARSAGCASSASIYLLY